MFRHRIRLFLPIALAFPTTSTPAAESASQTRRKLDIGSTRVG